MEKSNELQQAITKMLEHIRYLKADIAVYPRHYDSESIILDQLDKRGEKGRDMRSVRLGFSIGYGKGFLSGKEFACREFAAISEYLMDILSKCESPYHHRIWPR